MKNYDNETAKQTKKRNKSKRIFISFILKSILIIALGALVACLANIYKVQIVAILGYIIILGGLIKLFIPSKKKLLIKNFKRIKKGMHIEDVKGILSLFHIEEEGIDLKNNYYLTYEEKGLFKGSSIIRSIAFNDNHVVEVPYEIENQQALEEKQFKKISRISQLIMLSLAFISLLMIFAPAINIKEVYFDGSFSWMNVVFGKKIANTSILDFSYINMFAYIFVCLILLFSLISVLKKRPMFSVLVIILALANVFLFFNVTNMTVLGEIWNNHIDSIRDINITLGAGSYINIILMFLIIITVVANLIIQTIRPSFLLKNSEKNN